MEVLLSFWIFSNNDWWNNFPGYDEKIEWVSEKSINKVKS